MNCFLLSTNISYSSINKILTTLKLRIKHVLSPRSPVSFVHKYSFIFSSQFIVVRVVMEPKTTPGTLDLK